MESSSHTSMMYEPFFIEHLLPNLFWLHIFSVRKIAKNKMKFQLSFRDNRIDNDFSLNSFTNYCTINYNKKETEQSLTKYISWNYVV